MALWQELVTTAILGTERRAPSLQPGGDALSELVSRLDQSDPEAALLGAAAATALHRAAGQLPISGVAPTAEPCGPEDAPRCSAMSGHHLGLMLRGEYREVLPEWLGAVAAAGKRAREERLPGLLELGRTQAELREAILAVLGRRGLWLAGQSPDWTWVTGVTDEGIWETGDRAARRWFVATLRRDDAHRARELVAATWADETPEDRAAFLGSFEVGLSMGDEAFLESALDDSRKEVRQVAADMLARLPASRLCGRMVERLGPLLSYSMPERRGLLASVFGRQGSIEVSLPDECDKALQRDGIERRPPSGWGEKAWWLAQMIGAVPPEHWLETWQTSPEDLIALANQSEWKASLFEGWRQATLRHGDARWAEALLIARIAKTTDLDPSGLAMLLPADKRETIVLTSLETGSGHSGEQGLGLQLLVECRHPWSEALTRGVLAQLERRSPQAEWVWREAMRRSTLFMAPTLAEAVETTLAAVVAKDEGWGRVADDCTMLLRFRHDMLEEIAR